MASENGGRRLCRRGPEGTSVKQALIPLAVFSLLLTGAAALAAAPGVIPADPGWEKGRLLKGGLSDVDQAEREAAAGHYKAAYTLFNLGYHAAETAEGHAYALRREAECQLANQSYYKAQKSYKKLLENYAPFIPLEETLGAMRKIAEIQQSGEASPFGFHLTDLAVEAYEAILTAAPAGKGAPADMTRLAKLQAAGNKTAEAVDTYREISRRFPRTAEASAARIEVARLLLDQGARGDGDGRYTRGARNEMLRFIEEFPGDTHTAEAQALLAKANGALADRLVELGKFYLRRYSYRPATARRYFYDAIRLYPNTEGARTAQALLAKLEADEAAAKTPGTPVKPPKAPEPPPEILKPLNIEEREKVEKWLLPLEIKDYSEQLRKSHEARDGKKAAAEPEKK